MKPTLKIKRRGFLLGASAPLGALGLGLLLEQTVPAAGESPAASLLTLAALEKLIDKMGAESPVYLRVPPKDGRLLNLLVRMTGARKALEIGTAHGYAALWISRGLADTNGHLTTIEILPDRVDMAREHVRQAGLSGQVTCKEGDAHQIVAGLPGPFDFVYLNADKSGQVDYFNQLFPGKLAPGGLLLSSGAIQQIEKLQGYLDLVSHHPEFDTVMVSATLEDGIAVSYRKK
jgi:caffeoyl-CoA O-methyltransferase